MSDLPNPALRDILDARNKIAQRLEANPDFIALRRLDSAIAEIEKAVSGPYTRRAFSEIPVVPAQPPPLVSTRKISQPDAVAAIIAELGKPLSSDELVPLVEAKGVRMSGEKRVNLASALSRDERFHSIQWGSHGRKWWFKDREPPSPIQELRLQTNSASPVETSEAVN